MLTARRTLRKGEAPKRSSRKRLQNGGLSNDPMAKYNFLHSRGNDGNSGQIVQRGGLTPGATIKSYTFLFAGARPSASPTLGTFGARGFSNFGKSGGMVFDNDGMMYVATSCGIVRIDKSGTVVQYVRPNQLGSTLTDLTNLYLALAWIGTTKSTLIVGSTSHESQPRDGTPYPLVLIKIGTPPVVTIKSNLSYNVMTMCSDSKGNVYWTGDSMPGSEDPAFSANKLSVIYRIDPTGTTVVPFLGNEYVNSPAPVKGQTLPVNNKNGLSGRRGPMGGLSYNPVDDCIYLYNGSAAAGVVKISLTDNTFTGIDELPMMGYFQGGEFDGAYASVVDPILNVLYMYNANWNNAGFGLIFMYDLTLKRLMRFSGTGTFNGNAIVEGGLFPAGESTIVVPTATNPGSFVSTNKGYPSTCRHMAIDEAGYVYFGDYGGSASSTSGMPGFCRLYMISPYGQPQAPSTFSVDATKTTGSSITITWSNDTNAAEYIFTILPLTPGIVMPKGRATTATFSNLADSTTYVITLQAKNMLGLSPITTFSAVATPLNTSGFALSTAMPISMNLIGTTSTVVGVYLSWAGILNIPYVQYTITPTNDTESKIIGTIPQNPVVAVTKTPHTVTGLAPSTTYTVRIIGSVSNTFPTGANTTSPSNSLTFTTPASVPPMFLGTLVGGPSNKLSTRLNQNRAIALDASGNMYIPSTTCIYKVSPSRSTTNWLFNTAETFPTPTAIPYTPTKLPIGVGGSTATLFAGSTTAGSPSTTPQTGAAIAFGNIIGMTYSSADNSLYVLDAANNVIVKVTLVTPVTASIVAGKLRVAPASTATVDGGPAVSTLSSTTSNIFSGQNSQIYITDSSDATKVRVLDTLANANTISSVQLLLGTPSSSVVQLPDGTLLVTSATRNQIFRLTIVTVNPLTYRASVFAGRDGSPGNVDGPAASATFNKPTSLALDAASNVYVYDSGNCSIRVIIDGNVYTYLGGNPGLVDGPAASAGLSAADGTNSFSGMAFDSNGFLYISDTVNNAVRVVAPYPADQVISDSQLTGYRASAAQASSAVAQTASSAVAQTVSSALAQAISGAQQSSAVAQQDSSAQYQAMSGAQQSSAIAQLASKAEASSALAQAISGAQQSSAVAQQDSSAQAQAVSGAQQSSAIAQLASKAEASSALAQSISGAQQSSAIAQLASKAEASSALAQAISGAQQSSAVAQQDSSAQYQAMSGAQQSSAIAQLASKAEASSALAQAISGAQQSSAVAQQASSALAQAVSGAQQSSAIAQLASKAEASSSVQQADSSAQQQFASSAKQQFASSAVQQADSSAQQQTALAAAVAIKDEYKATLLQLQSDIAKTAQAIYGTGSSTVSGSTMLTLQNKMLSFDQAKRDLLDSAPLIFQLSPGYQDPSLQTIIQDNTLSAFGVKKVFDALRNNYIFLDTSNRIIASPLTPYLRAYTSGAAPQRGGGKGRKNSRKSAVLFYQA